MEDDRMMDPKLEKAIEDALRGDPKMTTQDLCSLYREVPQHKKEMLGKLIEKWIGGLGTQFYKLLLAIAEEHCQGG